MSITHTHKIVDTLRRDHDGIVNTYTAQEKLNIDNWQLKHLLKHKKLIKVSFSFNGAKAEQGNKRVFLTCAELTKVCEAQQRHPRASTFWLVPIPD